LQRFVVEIQKMSKNWLENMGLLWILFLDHGLSPVHFATMHGHQDIVDFLVQQGFQRSLASDLRKEFNKRSLSDIAFRVEGKVFYAHRALLKVRAPHFYKIINERFLYEARLDKVSWKAFEGFMEHLYTGRVNFVENLQAEIAAFAKLYHVPFNLKNKENSQLHCDMMQLLKASSEFGDVILKSQEGERFKSHRFVLAARSEYFRAMFSGNFKESHHQEISLSEVSSDCLSTLLNFLYTDTIEDPFLVNNQTAIDLMGLCDQYFFLDKVKIFCEKAVVKNGIDIDSALEVLQFAQQQNSTLLVRYCVKLVAMEFEKVDLEMFENLAGELKKEIQNVKQHLDSKKGKLYLEDDEEKEEEENSNKQKNFVVKLPEQSKGKWKESPLKKKKKNKRRNTKIGMGELLDKT